MEGVGFFTMLIVGALAGWIAEKLTRSDHGLITNIILGIVGAFVGGMLASLFGVTVRGFFGTLIAAVVGATLVIVAYRAIMGRRTHT
jgi:uncharacterized membrane protein YeaQ/YmgE (transglycosylase-associated protein family)